MSFASPPNASPTGKLARVEDTEVPETVVDLAAVADDGNGVLWSLHDSEDLNVNLVHLGPGALIGNHVNRDVDVVLLALDGSGTVVVDGRTYVLKASTLAYVPRSSERKVQAGPEGLRYVSLHRGRGLLTVGRRNPRSSPR